jgi:hypothetical protein
MFSVLHRPQMLIIRAQLQVFHRSAILSGHSGLFLDVRSSGCVIFALQIARPPSASGAPKRLAGKSDVEFKKAESGFENCVFR